MEHRSGPGWFEAPVLCPSCGETVMMEAMLTRVDIVFRGFEATWVAGKTYHECKVGS